MIKVEQIDHVALTVADMERSVAWYQDTLGLERRHQDVWRVPVMLCAGTTCVALFLADVESPSPAPDPNETIGLRHFAFILSRADFEQARSELEQRGVEFSFEDHTIAHSLYIFDPDGYRVELTTYEL
ncbi:MAG: VOC family protein [Chloroflexia bacterium]